MTDPQPFNTNDQKSDSQATADAAPQLPPDPDCPLTPPQLRSSDITDALYHQAVLRHLQEREAHYEEILASLPENRGGKKYLRELKGLKDGKADVYTVIETFAVSRSGCQQALKKILCTGQRGKADVLQDLREAIDALVRDVEIEIDRQRRAASDAE